METETKETTSKEAPDDMGRLARLAAEIRGLIDDVRSWIDLKLQLLEVQVEDRVRDFVNRIAVTVIIATMAFLSFVFVLVTGALALGTWWGDPVLGFLAVTLALIVLTTILYVLRPGLAGKKAKKEPEAPGKLDATPERIRLTEGEAPPRTVKPSVGKDETGEVGA